MRDYKIGDELLVKGKVYGIDDDSGSYSYLVDFDKPFGTSPSHYWVRNNYIADEEPVKPVLPKDIADEMASAKENGCNFYAYLDHSYTYPATRNFIFTWSHHDAQIKILSDAWYNGYTVDQEPRYKVYVPGTNKQYMYVKRGELAKAHNKKATPITPQSINNYLTAGGNRDLYWFTDEEITKFDLQDCDKEPADDNED